MYLPPALLDWLIFLVLFAVLYGAGERGWSIRQCAWLGGSFQLAYMCTSFVIGLALSRARAKTFLLVGTAGAMVVAIGCLILRDYHRLLVALSLLGTCGALFYNSFQTFMRGEAAPGGLARTIGLYNLAWSGGSALGLLSSGVFYRGGAVLLVGTAVVVCALVFVLLLRHQTRPADQLSADEHVEQGTARARVVDGRYVGVAWLVIFMINFVQRPIHTFFPALCAQNEISSTLAGLPLFLLMSVQAIFGLVAVRWRDSLYRRTPLAVVQLLGMLCMLALWRWHAYWVSLTAIGLFGCICGYLFFAAIYYGSNSGRRSFNIGVNEFLVGVGSFGGLFVCEWWMKRTGQEHNLYMVCAVAMAITLAAQLLLVSGHTKKTGKVALPV